MMSFGGFDIGVHVSGQERDLADALASTIASVGLLVAPPILQQRLPPSISTGIKIGFGIAFHAYNVAKFPATNILYRIW
jgi:hypothetical protein